MKRTRDRSWLIAVLGLVAGLLIGLWAGSQWLPRLARVSMGDLDPAQQDDYVALVALAYTQTGDLGWAETRLRELEAPNPGQLVMGVLERKQAAGEPAPTLTALAQLALALGVARPELIAYLPSPTPLPTPTPLPPTPTPIPPSPTPTPTAEPPTATPTPAAVSGSVFLPILGLETTGNRPTATPSATRPPTATPTPTQPPTATPTATPTAASTALPTVKNGNFEQGNNGDWIEFSSNGFDLILSDNLPITPRSGQWIAWLGGLDNEISDLSQPFQLPPSGPIYLRFHYW
ncbi:MAG: hypothetical protein NZP34_12195, partial [Caldilineales bacterium]|nr:hypothetical protein [Caldilineales bacterium]